ncbi:MAG: helix-turn-helix transcriptional regulator [Clostridia bacterium]|nr:helix-turn-helix transcriptional regulator [Clostridia bacterium]
MRKRAHKYGSANVIGANVERLRKQRNIKQKDFIASLQLAGLDVNPTSYSKLEGQIRTATDKEVYAIAKVLGIPMEELFLYKEVVTPQHMSQITEKVAVECAVSSI